MNTAKYREGLTEVALLIQDLAAEANADVERAEEKLDFCYEYAA